MHVISINIGQPQTISHRGKAVSTGIFKRPVAHEVEVTALGLAGDVQVDRRFHGGIDKAIYCYASEHYDYWRTQLGDAMPTSDPPWGLFGENITTAGLVDEEVSIGDMLRVGPVVLQITQPRLPCFKLGAKFARPQLVKEFARSGRLGYYCRVLTPGRLAAEMPIEFVERAHERYSLVEAAELYWSKAPTSEALRRAMAQPGISDSWREEFEQKLASFEK